MVKDFRIAARALRRRPGYALVAVLTIALGVGANAAVFRLVDGVLLRPLSFSAPDDVVVLHETDRHNGTRREGASMPDYFDWRSTVRSFSTLAAYQYANVTLSEAGAAPARLRTAAVSASYLPLAGLKPQLGRNFSPEEDRPGGTPSVLLSERLWRDRFAASSAVIGRSVDIDGHSYTIVGVLPGGIEVPAAELWLPLEAYATAFRAVRGAHNLTVIGRLANGVALGAAQSEMTAVSAELEARYPDDNGGRGAFVVPVGIWIAGDSRPTLSLLTAAVGLVLLIACFNVAGLALARMTAGEGDFAVRLSLGATRLALARQGFAENLLLAGVGALAGSALPGPLLRALLRLSPDALPRTIKTAPDARLFVLALAAALVVALVVSAVTALRFSSLPVAGVLSTRSGESPRAARWRRALVVTEVAAAIALTAMAGLLMTSFARLTAQDPGVRVASTLVASTSLPPWRYPVPSRSTYPRWPEATSFYDRALGELRALPGVESAALALNHPLQQGWTSQIALDGNERPAGERDEVRIRPVTPGYLATVGLPLVAGRDLGDEDVANSAPTLMINRAFVRRYLADRDPLGHTVDFWGVRRRIIGVVGDEKFLGLDQEATPAVYPSLYQIPMGDVSLLVRAAGDPATLTPSLEKAVHAVDPGLALYGVRPLSAILDASVATPRLRTVLFSLFGLLAATLAGVGIYGLVAFDVERRRRDLALRMALGARARAVVAQVVRGALRTAAIGVVLGLAAALAAGRLVSTMLFATSLFDPVAIAIAIATGLLLAVLAAARPAARVARLDPAVVLREE